MSHKLLLPNKFKIIGWCLFIPATILGIIITCTDFEISWLHAKVFAILSDEAFGKSQLFHFIETNLTNTVVGIIYCRGNVCRFFKRKKRG